MKPVKALKPPPNMTLRTVEELCDHALVPREWMPALAKVAARYAVAITPAIAGLIDPSDPHDPIAKQFVPDARELAGIPSCETKKVTRPVRNREARSSSPA